MRVLFLRKDSFVGAGTIDKFVTVEQLEESERMLCVENNWYAKITFSRVVRFVPSISVLHTSVEAQNPLMVHGASISKAEAVKIEAMASAKIIL